MIDLKKLKEIASKKWDVAYVPSPMQLGAGDKVIIDDKEDITAVLIGGRSNDIMAMKEALPELIRENEILKEAFLRDHMEKYDTSPCCKLVYAQQDLEELLND